MVFCLPKNSASSYPQRLPEYLQRQQQQQRSSSSSPVYLERLEKNADAKSIDEVAAVLARSFAGNHERSGEDTFNWVIGPDFPIDDPTCEAKRIEFVTFFMKWSVLTCLEYGVVLVAKDGSLGSGRVLGAICSTPPGRSYVCITTSMFRWHMIKIAFRMGGPPSGVLGKEPFKRMEKMGEFMVKLHGPAETASIAANTNGTPPWYVAVLGIDVDAQGKGCGTALLDAIHYLADCDGADTMLEYTGEKKRVFYCKKMGYENFGEVHLISDPNKEKDDLAINAWVAIRNHSEPQEQPQ